MFPFPVNLIQISMALMIILNPKRDEFPKRKNNRLYVFGFSEALSGRRSFSLSDKRA